MHSCFFLSIARLLWEKEGVHCSKKEVVLTRVQEMFRPASVCVIGPDCWTPSLSGLEAKGLAWKTKPSQRLGCSLRGSDFNTTIFFKVIFFVLLFNTPPPHTCSCKWIFLHLCFAICSAEVTLKVHVSDASTHQPLAGVSVQLFANHTPLSAETSSPEGDTYLRFPFRLGTPLVVTATKQGYVLNSVPWTPSRLPGK